MNIFFKSVAVFTGLLIFIGGCSYNGSVDDNPDLDQPHISNEVISYEISSIKDQGIVYGNNDVKLAEVSAVLPKLSPDNDISKKINEYYEEMLEKYISDMKSELKAAGEANAQITEGEYIPCSASQVYEIALNNGKFLSVKRVCSQFLGGMHGNTEYFSDSFSLESGERLGLSDIFTVSADEYLDRIFREVLMQIRMDDSEYFGDYEGSVKTLYNTEDFYLTADSIVVFYSGYALGPYSLGIPEYSISFEDLDDILTKELLRSSSV